MKDTIIKGIGLFILLLSTHLAFAQVEFVEGYFVDASGNKVTCLIKDYGKENIPETLIYKREGATTEEEIETATLQEFQIESRNFRKFTVEIDKSPNKPPYFSKVKNGEYKTETVFLQTMSTGKASLYRFYEQDLILLFLQKDDQTPVQLLKKYYRLSNKEFKVNNLYRQQLWNELRCEGISQTYVSRMAYNSSAIIKLINKYNECQGGTTVNLKQKQSKWSFQVSAKAGVRQSSIEVNEPAKDVFPSKTSFVIGAELESFLPIKKNKWSVFFNPNFHYYPGAFSETNPNNFVREHSAIVLPLGLRYHIYLNDGKFDLFFNVQISQPIFLDNDILEDNTVLAPFLSVNFNGRSLKPGFGGGLAYMDRFIMEYRFGNLGRTDGFNNPLGYAYPFQTVTLGYVFLQRKQ